MVRLLGYSTPIGLDTGEAPREILKEPSPSGDNGWLIRFFDSSFFCEWIAVSYLYKHEHSGVRDYLCNKMYNLPLSGIESYLFQLCFMLVNKSSPSLEKFMADMCSKSLRIALKIHWFLMAETEETDETEELKRLQEKCQMAALMGDWPPLVRPKKTETSPSSRMLKFLSSKGLLSITTSPQSLKVSSPVSSPTPVTVEEMRSPSEESELSLKVLKKLMPGPKVRRPKESEPDGFFRRLWRDKIEDEKGVRSEELANSESFFRRIFRDKMDTEEKVGGKVVEEEGFFRRMFRDKMDDRDKGDDRDRPDEDEKGDDEESSEFFLFRRFLRIHPEDEKSTLTVAEAPNLSTPENSPGTDGFFKRLFRERTIEDSRTFNLRREDGSSPSSFLRKLFKDRNDEVGGLGSEEKARIAVGSDLTAVENGTVEEHKEAFREVQSNTSSGLYEMARSTTPGDISKLTDFSRTEKSATDDVPTTARWHENASAMESRSHFVQQPMVDASSLRAPESPEANVVAHARLVTKRPGSPKQRSEKSSAKPPLPKYSTFHLRKGTYHATLDFVQSLCDTSSGLVDVFPMEDRRKSLHESLVELNSHLAVAQNDGGVCFPMEKSLHRVVNIPEDEATLLNSREKAPYLICVEVVKCDEQSSNKEYKDSGPYKPSRGGIPLANGDVQLQRPPPWAYPLGNQPNMQQHNTDRMLRAASQAIDRAMNHSWDAKVKFVHVSLSITEKCSDAQDWSTDSTHVSNRLNSAEFYEEATELGKVQSDVDGIRNNGSLSGILREGMGQMCTEGYQNGECENRVCLDDCSDGKIMSVKGSAGARWTKVNSGGQPCEHEWVSVLLTSVSGVSMEDVEDEEPLKRKDHRRVPSTIAMAEVKAAAAKEGAPPGLPVKKSSSGTEQTQSEVPAKILDIAGRMGNDPDALAGELWEHKKERIRKASKFGNIPGWDLFSVIVKSGDDCRQEHLAVQLITHFYDIFQEAGLPLWLRPYEVLVTSSYTALIETIPDTASIHAIKSRNPNLFSLREFFCNKYEENSPAFKFAQRNFVESMAAYSILCYFLQIKDRHNGNLLIDEDGHIIHIDFGFMLSNSPGGVNFESAPFKLTRELLEVMDSDAEGTSSEFFDYFKVLCIQGFLTCRKHAERIILLVEMMQDSGFPCFKGGPRTILNLRKRFHLTLTEEQCVSLVLSLISSSLDAWRTRQYDYYQRVLNGIL